MHAKLRRGAAPQPTIQGAAGQVPTHSSDNDRAHTAESAWLAGCLFGGERWATGGGVRRGRLPQTFIRGSSLSPAPVLDRLSEPKLYAGPELVRKRRNGTGCSVQMTVPVRLRAETRLR